MYNFADGVLAFPKLFLVVLFLRSGSSQDSTLHSLRNKCQEGSDPRANKLDEFFYFPPPFFFTTNVPSVVSTYGLAKSYDFSNIVFVFTMCKI